jgi:hypothetical protein
VGASTWRFSSFDVASLKCCTFGGCYVGPVLGLLFRRVTGCGSVAEFVIRDERCGG